MTTWKRVKPCRDIAIELNRMESTSGAFLTHTVRFSTYLPDLHMMGLEICGTAFDVCERA